VAFSAPGCGIHDQNPKNFSRSFLNESAALSS
jgi:hypothetical protein